MQDLEAGQTTVCQTNPITLGNGEKMRKLSSFFQLYFLLSLIENNDPCYIGKPRFLPFQERTDTIVLGGSYTQLIQTE